METIRFPSGGVTCAGDLYLPEGASADSPRPGIVLGHGFTITKQSLAEEATFLSSNGYVCLAIDYRTFGESDGEPRGQLFPLNEAEDIRNAVSYLQHRPEVDAEKIGFWGASFGGALAIYTAGVDRRIKASVAVVPVINGRRWMQALKTSAEWEELLDRLEADRDRRYQTGESERIPSTGRSRRAALTLTDRTVQAFQSAAEKLGKMPVVNDLEITVESLEKIIEFSPDDVIQHIGPRALMIITTSGWDVVHLLEHIQDAYAKANEPKKLVLLPYTELDFYMEPGRSTGLSHALEWYNQHIPIGG